MQLVCASFFAQDFPESLTRSEQNYILSTIDENFMPEKRDLRKCLPRIVERAIIQ